MKVYAVFCPDGFEEYVIHKLFHSETKAREYIEDKPNWIVEEWRVE